jgi:hypothetical protein
MGKLTNETFGITFQYAVCEYFNLENSILSSRLDRRLLEHFLDSNIVPDIFKFGRPIEYLADSDEYTSNFIKRCPHSFLLENGETFSVRTFQGKGKMFAPKVVGQAGDETFNHFFGHLSNDVVNRSNFKKFCIENIAEMLPIIIDFALVSDYNCWIYYENENLKFEIINREDLPELTFEKSSFSFSKPNVNSWIESNTIKFKGKTILELQLHSNRAGYKIRLHRDNFPELLKVEKALNNSMLGDTAELAICNVFEIDAGANISRLRNNSDRTALKAFEVHYNLKKRELFPHKPIIYSGTEKRERGSHSKSGVDFYLENNLTLSVKTNKSKSFKVCPPEIGQPSPKTFDLYFAGKGWYQGAINDDKFRTLVRDKQILSELLIEYVSYLNECDFLLWSFYMSEKNIKSKLVLKKQLKNLSFDPSLIHYSNDFREQGSVTIKYGLKDISLGEFQVHSARNSLKFRFNLNNLLSIS